ncbi:MAG: 16S rRNA (guanine(966)-N(2))-methyltransferase RsmD [Thermodesulfovibrionales bacterium]
MRISGGVAKGRRVGSKKAFIQKSEEEELRPTSSKVREAIFDILQEQIRDASFLDLYAGTGAVGFEALSRGATRVDFVETSPLRVRIINHFLSEFNFKERSRVIREKVHDFIKKTTPRGDSYDVIFLDPPYFSDELLRVLSLLGEGGIARDGGIVIAEHFYKTVLPDTMNGLRKRRTYNYGDTSLSLYRLEVS